MYTAAAKCVNNIILDTIMQNIEYIQQLDNCCNCDFMSIFVP